MFVFEITEIDAGWLDVRVENDEDKTTITCSDYRGNDGAKELLKVLVEMFDHSNIRNKLYWDEEPGEYLWELSKEGNNLIYNIFYIDTLHDNKEELLISGDITYNEFVITIIEEFKKYSSEKNLILYNKQWFEFPNEEYYMLIEKVSVNQLNN